ncbi:Multidrug efflux pump subunit AcrA (membrane-fusion protein) [Lishizhenia tianjinensis]|uniref:Multidrug efflux pump subunit AcrA (Membrane-fusion protein) n=1 Tax=Lishizhenia tianjinensis TaxID=477690 RepID=A0A1I7AGZ2_9FLAO|nr:efflux RND transporter periplasmic adaptor subunit [Lishizhenia tianjinensis]SFT74206.1 Multidrug efflux pump subunit AcrA (membrane-fusion protein) [Lishizhenia tianjinensis]
MKARNIVLIILGLLLVVLIYGPILSKGQGPKTKTNTESATIVPVIKAKNQTAQVDFEAYGQVTPYTEINVVFEVQGKLLQGDKKLKPGHSFKKGSVLYSVDQSEELYAIYARRSSFNAMLVNLMADIELDFPQELEKWKNFIRQIDDRKNLPELPSFNSDKEKRFINSRNIATEYYSIKSAETRLSKYIYRAPFDGTIVETYAEEGSYVSPATSIAKIVKTGDYEVKVPIKKEELNHFTNAQQLWFLAPNKDTVGTGKIIRTSNVVNQQTQSIDTYLSITPINGHKVYQGDFLNLSCAEKLEMQTVTLPHTAVVDNNIQILEDSLLQTVNVRNMGYKGDSLLIAGIPENAQVLCSFLQNASTETKYEAVEK